MLERSLPGYLQVWTCVFAEILLPGFLCECFMGLVLSCGFTCSHCFAWVGGFVLSSEHLWRFALYRKIQATIFGSKKISSTAGFSNLKW